MLFSLLTIYRVKHEAKHAQCGTNKRHNLSCIVRVTHSVVGTVVTVQQKYTYVSSKLQLVHETAKMRLQPKKQQHTVRSLLL